MKRVDTNLIPVLLELSENQVVKPVSKNYSTDIKPVCNTVTFPVEKKKVESGFYEFEVVFIKSSSKTAYKLDVKILSEKYPEQPIVSCYCRRDCSDFSDLDRYFRDDKRITSPIHCIGKIGFAEYRATEYGWLNIIPKSNAVSLGLISH